MKKIYLLFVLIGLIGTSCSQDNLDIEQKGVLELEKYYAEATDAEAESLIAAVHKCFFTDAMGVASFLPLNLMGGDSYCGGNSFSDSASRWRLFSYYTYSFNHQDLIALYRGLFRVNYWCNLIVEKLPNDSQIKRRAIAEAKFIRAVCYIYLVRIWGTPPLVDSSETTDTPPNGNPTELWSWIELNLNEAINELPSKPGRGMQQTVGGRPTKQAALSYLGKAQLLQGKYAEASATLKQVIDSNVYDLVDDMNTLFHPEADFCDEYIFEFNIENDASTGSEQTDGRYVYINWRYTNLASPEGYYDSGWGFSVSPTFEYVDFLHQHEMVNGERSKRYRAYYRDYNDVLAMKYLPEKTPGIVSTVGFIADNIGYWGTRWWLRSTDVITGTGLTSAASVRSHSNHPYMRYVDVLLLFAEAEIGKGNTSGEGLAALNKVRTRAGLPALSSMSLQDVKDERRIEFWGDGERFLDLVRWGDAPTVLANVNKYRYQLNGVNPDGTFNVSSDGKVYGQGFVAGKNEYWPFPETELIANPNLVQNPGW